MLVEILPIGTEVRERLKENNRVRLSKERFKVYVLIHFPPNYLIVTP